MDLPLANPESESFRAWLDELRRGEICTSSRPRASPTLTTFSNRLALRQAESPRRDSVNQIARRRSHVARLTDVSSQRRIAR